MYTLEDIKKAFVYGNEKEYILFPEIRDEKIIGNVKASYEGLEELNGYADKVLVENSPKISFEMYKLFEKTGDRLTFENAYFQRRKQLFSVVLAYSLNKDKKYLPYIEEKLWEWCDLYSWELPAHFKMPKNKSEWNREPDETVALFAAELAFFFAEIISIIGKELDELLVYRLKKEIFRRVINPYKSTNYWWETAKMNWSSVCAGSVGVAALYLIEDIEELSLITERVLNSMAIFMEAFDKDGLITEGLSYWSYGFSFYVYFAELLRERTAGKINLLNSNIKIKKIAELPQLLQFPSGDFVNFSDSGYGKWRGDSGLFSRLEEALGVYGYNYEHSLNIYNDHTSKWAMMARRLLWSSFTDKTENKDIKTGSFYFSESEWLIDRRVTAQGSFAAFAAKGGNNDEPHNHNDLGHFLLHYNGEDIFTDIGSPEYVKEYFRNETRYDFLASSSLGHSVPVINGKPQSFGKDHCAEVIKYDEAGLNTIFCLDLKKAYSCEELTRFRREFVWNYDNLELMIKDKFEFSKAENQVEETFISVVKPELVEPGKVLINANRASAELIYDEKLQCVIEQCFYNNHMGEKSHIYKIVFTANLDKFGEYIFKIKLNNKASSKK
jgi:hypothetical protein